MIETDRQLNSMFKLEAGYSAETSGGLLIALTAEKASDFVSEFERRVEFQKVNKIKSIFRLIG